METTGRKTIITIIVIIVALIVLVGAALLVYNNLTQSNAGKNVTTQTAQRGDGSDDVMGSMNPNASNNTTPTKAADFSVMNANQYPTTLSEFAGKPVVINFWATWCPYCVQELPGFQNSYEKYNSDVQFMMIDATDGSRETLGDAQAFLADNGYTFPAFFDTEQSAVTAYGLTSFPTTYFINADGTVYGVAVGMMDENKLNQTIEAMLAAQ